MLRVPASAYLSVTMSAKRGGSLFVIGALGILAVLGVSALGSDGSAKREPLPPSGVEVVAGAQNMITWQRDPAASGAFRVYRSSEEAGEYQLLGSTSSDSFLDEPAARGIYWYRVAVATAAGEDGPWSQPVSSDRVRISEVVGPAGGTLEPTTGTVRLDIPAGAVAVPTTFTIDQLSSPPSASPGRELVTRAFEIGPSGTEFRAPATLTLAYDLPAGYGPQSTRDGRLGAQFWRPKAERWARLGGGEVDTATSTVTARIPHLSLWAAGSFEVPHGGYSSTTDVCRTCHSWHDPKSESGLLNNVNERELCYSCHDGTGASTDVRSQFGESSIGSSTKVSFHPVPQETDGLQLVCSDCHTGHKPLAEDTALLRVQDGVDADGNPVWLYSPPDTPIGNAFCYGCHGAGSKYPVPLGDHSGFDASAHNTITPPDPAGIVCLACHQPHGSDFPSLLQTADKEALCQTCHADAQIWGSSHVANHGQVCSDCHDVHGSSNAFMLTDSKTTGFDGTTATWQRLQTFCTSCHPEPTDAPHPDVDATQQLCTDCHYHGSSHF